MRLCQIMTKRRRRKRIPIKAVIVEPMFKSPGCFKFSQLPEDASFCDSYYSHPEQMQYLIFNSKEWKEVQEGEELPVFDIQPEYIFCPGCRCDLMHSEEDGYQVCPECNLRFPGPP